MKKLNGAAVLFGALGLGVATYALAQGERDESTGPKPRPPMPKPKPKPVYFPDVLMLPPPAPDSIPSHPVSLQDHTMQKPEWLDAKPAPKPAPKPKPKQPSVSVGPATIAPPLDYGAAVIEPGHMASAAQQAALLSDGHSLAEYIEPHAAAVPQTPAPQRSPSKAANELYAFVTPIIRAGGDLSKLGTNEAPSDVVAAAQRDMRIIMSDGVYGPKTAARGKELLGREFPSRSSTKKRAAVVWNPGTPNETTKPPPGTTLEAPPPLSQHVPEHSPQEAAAALFELVTAPPVSWGDKAHPNPLIKSAQHDMGGLTADGVYGPKTQARGAKLLGRAFPARS